MNNNQTFFYIEGTNYDLSGIKVTIKSLKEHSSCEITVLYKNIDSKLKDYFKSENINYLDCSSFKVTFNTSPYNNKIIYTYLYFKRNKEILKNSKLLFCDISDVFFKCDPFDLYANKLTVFSEDLTFSECDTNKTWANICYGQDMFEKCKTKTVINSGIIIASFDEMLSCFDLMLKDMAIILTRLNYPTTDQIILNKLIYIDNIPCFIDFTNANNMAQQIKTDVNNKINHQYKVFPQIKQMLYSKYE